MATWQSVLAAEKSSEYFQQLWQKIDEARQSGKTIFPPANEVFAAFDNTAFADIKVVILGQDPYHNDHQAHGLAFSVNKGIDTPPSLRNMYKELAEDIAGFQTPDHGYLMAWAKQGVLLLNNVLTVEAHLPHSHAKWGWERFTDAVIAAINEQQNNVVFMLWGKPAQTKGANIDTNKHLVLTAPHPSPLSAYRGFLGCQHFSKANAYLLAQGKIPIDWQLGD